MSRGAFPAIAAGVTTPATQPALKGKKHMFPPVPGVSNFQLAMRSFAVNVPFAIVAIGTAACMRNIFWGDNPNEARRKCLKILVECQDVPAPMLLNLLNAQDLPAFLRKALEDKDLDAALAMAFRRALAVTL